MALNSVSCSLPKLSCQPYSYGNVNRAKNTPLFLQKKDIKLIENIHSLSRTNENNGKGFKVEATVLKLANILRINKHTLEKRVQRLRASGLLKTWAITENGRYIRTIFIPKEIHPKYQNLVRLPRKGGAPTDNDISNWGCIRAPQIKFSKYTLHYFLKHLVGRGRLFTYAMQSFLSLINTHLHSEKSVIKDGRRHAALSFEFITQKIKIHDSTIRRIKHVLEYDYKVISSIRVRREGGKEIYLWTINYRALADLTGRLDVFKCSPYKQFLEKRRLELRSTAVGGVKKGGENTSHNILTNNINLNTSLSPYFEKVGNSVDKISYDNKVDFKKILKERTDELIRLINESGGDDEFEATVERQFIARRFVNNAKEVLLEGRFIGAQIEGDIVSVEYFHRNKNIQDSVNEALKKLPNYRKPLPIRKLRSLLRYHIKKTILDNTPKENVVRMPRLVIRSSGVKLVRGRVAYILNYKEAMKFNCIKPKFLSANSNDRQPEPTYEDKEKVSCLVNSFIKLSRF